MKFSFSRSKSEYSKAKLLRDTFSTLKILRFRGADGRVVSEVLEVIFACLQTALLQRGRVSIPSIGCLTLALDEKGDIKFVFHPCQDLVRKVKAAVTE